MKRNFKEGEKLRVTEDYTDVDHISVSADQTVTYRWAASVASYGKGHVIAFIDSTGDEIVIPKNLLTRCKNTSSNSAANPQTGSLRFNSGKPQCNEISPKFLLDMGAVLEKSRSKYPRGNWAAGNNFSVPYDSMMRHILAWQSGEQFDKETGQSHLAQAAINLMMLHYYEDNFPELDDRLFKQKDKK